MKTLIIIPAYNEAENIVSTMENLRSECPDIDYIIINDGSKDDTARLCRENNYNLLDLPINLGLVGAFQVGMQYASKHGYDAAMQFDADGQHLPEFVPKLCETLENTNADIVIGARQKRESESFSGRLIGSAVISFLLRIFSGANLTDPTSGMRIYSKKLIKEFAWNINYDPEPDTLAYLMRRGIKLIEVPVRMKEREGGESYLNFPNAVKYMLRVSMSIIIFQWFRKRGAMN